MKTEFAAYYDRLETLHSSLTACIEGVSEEDLNWVPDPGMNSLAVLVIHTARAERYWIGDVIGQVPSGRIRAEEFETLEATLEQLRSELNNALAHSHEVLSGLALTDLADERPSPTHERMVSVAWALAHALQHTALHVGHAEITRQLWDQQHAG